MRKKIMKTESEASINEYKKLSSNSDSVSEKNNLDKLSTEDKKISNKPVQSERKLQSSQPLTEISRVS
jgi:hypothetical protein